MKALIIIACMLIGSVVHAESMEQEPLNDTWGNPQWIVKDDKGARIGHATCKPINDTYGNRVIKIDYDDD